MSHQELRIGFVGGGNMAQAIVNGLIAANHDAGNITVADPDAEQLAKFGEIDSRIVTSGDNDAAVRDADATVLAVKPQILDRVVRDIQPTLGDRTIVVSIAAGVRLGQLERWLGSATAIVRTMPNQPALVGAGMTVLTANPACGQQEREVAGYIAGAVGEVAWIDDDGLMDAVTAVSGSGPAYFYLLMEEIESAARRMGLSDSLARQLVRQTALGAGVAAGQSPLALDQLRASVTSKGGTTAAAIEVFEAHGLRSIVDAALAAAHERSVELGASAADGS